MQSLPVDPSVKLSLISIKLEKVEKSVQMVSEMSGKTWKMVEEMRNESRKAITKMGRVEDSVDRFEAFLRRFTDDFKRSGGFGGRRDSPRRRDRSRDRSRSRSRRRSRSRSRTRSRSRDRSRSREKSPIRRKRARFTDPPPLFLSRNSTRTRGISPGNSRRHAHVDSYVESSAPLPCFICDSDHVPIACRKYPDGLSRQKACELRGICKNCGKPDTHRVCSNDKKLCDYCAEKHMIALCPTLFPTKEDEIPNGGGPRRRVASGSGKKDQKNQKHQKHHEKKSFLKKKDDENYKTVRIVRQYDSPEESRGFFDGLDDSFDDSLDPLKRDLLNFNINDNDYDGAGADSDTPIVLD